VKVYICIVDIPFEGYMPPEAAFNTKEKADKYAAKYNTTNRTCFMDVIEMDIAE